MDDAQHTKNLPPPPRAVRLRPEARGRVWVLRVATLPFLAAGMFLIFKLVESPFILMFGADATGRIEAVQPYWRSADGRRFDITFTFEADGVRERGYGRIDTGGDAPPAVGQSLPIRTLTAGALRRAELRDGDGGASGLMCGGLFATVWCGFVGIFTAVAWLGPIFDRRLIRDGVAAVGTVNGKRERKSGRNLIFEILYQFRGADGAERSGVARVSPELFEQLRDGQPVSVMYRASNPTRSSLYEASDYEVVADSRDKRRSATRLRDIAGRSVRSIPSGLRFLFHEAVWVPARARVRAPWRRA